MNRLHSLSASDRFNYGDLLFPLVLEASTNAPITHLALTKSDLSSIGGRPTEAVGVTTLTTGSSLIIAGGDVLTSNWYGALWQLRPRREDLLFRAAFKTLPRQVLTNFARRRFGSDWGSPFVAPEELCKAVPVVYNAVGGSDFLTLPAAGQSSIARDLKAASFISVRDSNTRNALIKAEVESHLYPDSVAAMRHHGWQTTALTHPQRIVFQASSHWIRNNLQSTIEHLTLLQQEGWEIAFVPIGLAGGHSDLSAYASLRSQLSNITLLPHSSLDEVRESICSGAVFAGSSLHGHITAVACGRPSIILFGVSKLSSYAETWTDEITVSAGPLNNISGAVANTLQISQSRRDEVGSFLAELATEGTKLALAASHGASG